MPLLQALRMLHGDYGTIAPGEVFDPGDDDTAMSLESRGLACRWRPARPEPRKAYAPSEVKAILPLEQKNEPRLRQR